MATWMRLSRDAQSWNLHLLSNIHCQSRHGNWLPPVIQAYQAFWQTFLPGLPPTQNHYHISTQHHIDASAPVVIEDDQDADNIIPVICTGHWPKQPLLPPSPKYNLSLIPPPSYSVRLKDLTLDKLISWINSVEFPESSSHPPASSSHKTVRDQDTIISSSNSAPLCGNVWLLFARHWALRMQKERAPMDW